MTGQNTMGLQVTHEVTEDGVTSFLVLDGDPAPIAQCGTMMTVDEEAFAAYRQAVLNCVLAFIKQNVEGEVIHIASSVHCPGLN